MDNYTPDMSQTLVQYLDGELPGAEKQQLEENLRTSSSLQGEYENLLLTREAIRFGGLQQQVASIHQDMMEELRTPVKKISSFRKIVRYSVAVAASLLLIVGGYLAYNFYTLSPNGIFASNYQSYELSSVRDGNTVLSPVEKAYQEKNYKLVAQLGAASVDTKEEFLAAMSDIELNNNTAAISMFKKIIAVDHAVTSNLFKDEAEYYLALTYIRNKDYDFALDLLHVIHDNPNHVYNGKVTNKLIRQVKMLKWR